MIKILFLCAENSCRSQIAEGWAKHLKKNKIECWSAGIEKAQINPLVVKVMAEKGVDLSSYYSKTVSELGEIQFDYVIIVCGNTGEKCPTFSANTKIVHSGFDDPEKLSKKAKNEEETLKIFRKVRDEIKRFVETLPESLEKI